MITKCNLTTGFWAHIHLDQVWNAINLHKKIFLIEWSYKIHTQTCPGYTLSLRVPRCMCLISIWPAGNFSQIQANNQLIRTFNNFFSSNLCLLTRIWTLPESVHRINWWPTTCLSTSRRLCTFPWFRQGRKWTDLKRKLLHLNPPRLHALDAPQTTSIRTHESSNLPRVDTPHAASKHIVVPKYPWSNWTNHWMPGDT